MKKELLDLVEELSFLDNLTGRGADLALLKREYKRVANVDTDSLAEQEQIEKFTNLYLLVAAKEGTLLASTYDEKKAIVNKAKELLNEKNYKKATEAMNALFDEFKAAGRCTKEQDDELWAEFKATKDQFYANKKAYFNEVAEKRNSAKEAKEAIIEEAKAVLEMENFKQGSQFLDELMEKWKAAGFAAKEENDALWERFNAIRQEFYAKRKEYFANIESHYAEKAAAKEAIIKKARIALANSTFTKEEVNGVKELRNEWKAVGFSGKDNDDRLWEEFQSVVNKYFEELKSYKE